MVCSAMLSIKETEYWGVLAIEGKIKHVYTDIIPGSNPKIRGSHYLFCEEKKITPLSTIGESIQRDLPDIGFWTIYGCCLAKEGERVRAILTLHENEEGYIVLMPVPSSEHSVRLIDENLNVRPKRVISSCGFSILNLLGCRISSFPVGILLNLFASESPTRYETAIEDSYNIWTNEFPDKLSFVTNVCPLPPCIEPFHYTPILADGIPPKIPGGPSPLMQILTYEQGECSTTQAGLKLLIDKNRKWTRSSNPGPDEYHFPTAFAHELGHGIGIGHLSDTNSLMYEELGPGVVKSLQQQDKDAVNELY